MQNDPIIKGVCFGSNIKYRDEHEPLVELNYEDDGKWYFWDEFSSAWIDDLIDVLHKTKQIIEQKSQN